MIKLKFLFFVCIIFMNMNNAWALWHWTGALVTAWGHRPAKPANLCNAHNPGTACIGKDAEHCKQGEMTIGHTYGDHGIMMLVAHPVPTNGGGAAFYPTAIMQRNCWATVSRMVINPSQWKVMLCKKGHSGAGCTSGTVSMCNSAQITREKYSGLGYADTIGGWWSENDLATFYRDEEETRKCPGNKSNNILWPENTMIFAVEEFEPNGHGAFVRPYLWRIVGNGTYMDVRECSVAVSPVADEPAQLWCAEGYTQNADDTACVPVKIELCDTWCEGWSLSTYNANKTERVLYFSETGNCLQSRCKDAKKAFDPSTWKCSVDCIKDSRNGISPDDGTCVTCAVGEVFDSEAKEGESSFCKNATALGASSLQYGPNGQNKDFKDQCWSKEDPAEYKNCVLGISKSGKSE